MKLKTKLSLVYVSVVLAIVVIVGSVSYNNSAKIGTTDAKNTMQTSADLVSEEIAAKLNDFLKMASVSGNDPLLSAEDATAADHINTLAAAYGFTSGNILDVNGISRKDGTDFSDRDYVQKALRGIANISDLTLSKYTAHYGFSVASPVYKDSNEINGVVYYRMDIDFMHTILDHIDISENGYTYLVDGTGTIIVHPDKNLIDEYNISDPENGLGNIAADILSKTTGAGEYDKQGISYLCGYSPIDGSNGWTVVVTAPKEDFMASTYASVKTLIIVDIIALIAALFLAGFFSNSIGKAVQNVSMELAYLSSGKLDHQMKPSKRRDEIGQLQNSTGRLQQTFKEIISETNLVLEGISNYDLTRSSVHDFPGDFNQLSVSVNRIQAILQRLIREVQEASSSVGRGSSELADAADALAAGTVTQASSISELVTQMENMAESIARNSDNEDEIHKRLQSLDQLILNGNDEMGQLRTVVSQVEAMSSDIQNIVGTIESIAFQINILALNASVEAARAGESGRGFAVVADEVGNLAAKTTEASKQTSDLISNCLKQIEQAMVCADSTSKCLNDIVTNSEQISDAFQQISIDTREQADKSARIKTEIANISDVVQTNTATAEETAAATQELSEQAKNLSNLIAKFRV